jgi:large-conductance mechanosensitive channel
MLAEFKKFALRGIVVDLVAGVIVQSLVGDI